MLDLTVYGGSFQEGDGPIFPSRWGNGQATAACPPSPTSREIWKIAPRVPRRRRGGATVFLNRRTTTLNFFSLAHGHVVWKVSPGSHPKFSYPSSSIPDCTGTPPRLQRNFPRLHRNFPQIAPELREGDVRSQLGARRRRRGPPRGCRRRLVTGSASDRRVERLLLRRTATREDFFGLQSSHGAWQYGLPVRHTTADQASSCRRDGDGVTVVRWTVNLWSSVWERLLP